MRSNERIDVLVSVEGSLETHPVVGVDQHYEFQPVLFRRGGKWEVRGEK